MIALPELPFTPPFPSDQVVSCEHGPRCGGCPLIALPYAAQLRQKYERVRAATASYPSLAELRADAVVPAPSLVAYRTRAKLMVAPGGRLGLFAKGGGHDVVDIPDCRVLTPTLARVAAFLRTRIVAAEASGGALQPFDPGGRGSLRAVDVREVRRDDGPAALVTFVVERARVTEVMHLRSEAAELMRAVADVIGVAVNFHVGDSPQILGGETVLLAGIAAAPDRIGSSLHLATFGSFVQVHREQAARVHDVLVKALAEVAPANRKAKVLDLYGGSGAIGLGLAAAGASVHLIESFAPAALQARAAAQALGLDVTAERADASAALRVFSNQKVRFDAIVLNPPRRGARPEVREGLARLEPQIVAYVSCDPATLARDIDHLARLGYAALSVRPFDMIPLTEEVETIAILRRGRVPAPQVLYEDSELLIVEKSPYEPTTPQGEYASSLLARTRCLPGADYCVPVHRLDVGTSGPVMFARRPEYVAKWARALSAATTRKTYLTAVRGVTQRTGTVARALREGGKLYRARTRYRRLATASGQSILRVIPEQGRTHQIRRHLASVGHPVLGDDRYGNSATNRYFEEKHALDRPFLHCARLEFDHPLTGVRHLVEAALPGDLRGVLQRMIGTGTPRFLERTGASGAPAQASSPANLDAAVGLCEGES